MLKNTDRMMYRNLGNTGLKVSILSFGNMVNYREQTREQDKQIVLLCLDNGINFFDTAELYASGKAEERLGQIFSEIEVSREEIVVSSKVWISPQPEINSHMSLNSKHIKEGLKGSLQRLKMEYVDIVFAHAYDPQTSIEQICRAFHELIEEGLTFYWGTSNWDADAIYEAFRICENLNLHRPCCAQNQYNMFRRKQIESEYQSLFKKYKYGLMAWSPLAGGYLTGKYRKGIDQKALNRFTDIYETDPETLKKFFFYPNNSPQNNHKLDQLEKFANDELDCDLTQLALAWCLNFSQVNTIVAGFRDVEQLRHNLKALEVAKKLNSPLEKKVNNILANSPAPRLNYAIWGGNFPSLRPY